MRQLREALIGKKNVSLADIKNGRNALYVVIPCGVWYDLAEELVSPDPDWNEDSADVWLMNWEQLNKIFTVKNNRQEIERGDIRVWPESDLSFDSIDKDIQDYIGNDYLGTTKCLTYKEIKKIWHL